MATKTYEPIVGKVTKVMTPQQNDERITLVFDCEFETINAETGEAKQTNMVGINIYNLVSQIGDKEDHIQLADMLAMGNMVNPQIISLALTNSDMEIERTFKKKGDKRENTDDKYTSDCITSKITNVKTHISPIVEQMLNKLVTEKPCIVRSASVPNPFAI